MQTFRFVTKVIIEKPCDRDLKETKFPLCFTDLFKNKSIAYVLLITALFHIKSLTSILHCCVSIG